MNLLVVDFGETGTPGWIPALVGNFGKYKLTQTAN